jgi:hypothetical protein
MAGPQEISFTDTASADISVMWKWLGWDVSHLQCVGWLRVFRPLRFAAEAKQRHQDKPLGRRVSRPLGALDSASGAVLRRTLRPPEPPGRTEDLTPDALASNLCLLSRRFELRPDYEDERFVDWLLSEAAAVTSRGTLVARLVRDESGAALGWFVYYLPDGGIAQVLQIAGPDRDIGAVIDHLLHDAWSRGACAIQGRAEAHLIEHLVGRRAVFHPSGYLVLVYSRDRELVRMVQSGDALLTRLDGDWWMGHHAESFA